MFAYCKNNSVNMADPNGYLPSALLLTSLTAGAVSSLVSFGTTLITQIATNNFDASDLVNSAVTGFLAGAAMPIVGTSTVGAIFVSAGASLLSQVIHNVTHEKPIMKDTMSATFFGGLIGRIGGKFNLVDPYHTPSIGGVPKLHQGWLNKMYLRESVQNALKIPSSGRAITLGFIQQGKGLIGNLFSNKFQIGNIGGSQVELYMY